MSIPLLKPKLYVPADGDGVPALLGGRCRCGYVFFPMQTFGCERCGATGEALEPMKLRGRGTLVAAATVHRHHDPSRPTPFVVGTIALDDGPVVRTLLVGADGTPLDEAPVAGSVRVEAVLVSVAKKSDGNEVLDLRFRPGSGSR